MRRHSGDAFKGFEPEGVKPFFGCQQAAARRATPPKHASDGSAERRPVLTAKVRLPVPCVVDFSFAIESLVGKPTSAFSAKGTKKEQRSSQLELALEVSTICTAVTSHSLGTSKLTKQTFILPELR